VISRQATFSCKPTYAESITHGQKTSSSRNSKSCAFMASRVFSYPIPSSSSIPGLPINYFTMGLHDLLNEANPLIIVLYLLISLVSTIAEHLYHRISIDTR
jgi:hypothetical protein